MSITGSPDAPPVRVGVAIADIVTGMFAAQGVSMALYARERTGRGQLVDVSMLDSVAALLTYQAGIYFATDAPPVRMGNRHPTIVPYETFSASDGDFVLAVGNDEQWRRFCEVAGIDAGEQFATNRGRVTGYAELRPIVAGVLRPHPRRYWIEKLTAAGVPCGSVRDLREVFSDPQLAARDMVVPMHHAAAGDIRVLGTPIKLSDTPAAMRAAPPTLGEHTDCGAGAGSRARAAKSSASCAPRGSSDGSLRRSPADPPGHRTREARGRRSARRQRRSRRASTACFSISSPCRCSGRSRGVLRAEGYLFNLFTPGGSVRLMSDKSADDFIELVLDTTGAVPHVIGRTSRALGQRTNVSEQPLNPSAPIRELTEDDVLAFLLKALEPFVER